MNIKTIIQSEKNIAVIHSNDIIITDSQAMLDLIATVGYEHDCDYIAIYKEALTEEFFKLSTGVAGEVLQKFINYRKKLAIIGDYSGYTSKPLHDFICESNKRKY